jgi:hypothetical protein
MKNQLRFAHTIILSFMLTATAAAADTPAVVQFDKAAAAGVKIIGIVTPAMPAQPTAFVLGGFSEPSGTLLGRVIQSPRIKELWLAIDGDKQPPPGVFIAALTAALQANGYAVKTIDAARPDAEFLAAYPAGAQVDAFLDVWFSEECEGYGYVTPGQENANPFKAFAYASFRLVRASDHAVLAQNTIFYTPWWKQDTENSLTIQPNPAYTFQDFSDIKANPKLAKEGLHYALRQIADTIGTLLY